MKIVEGLLLSIYFAQARYTVQGLILLNDYSYHKIRNIYFKLKHKSLQHPIVFHPYQILMNRGF